MFIFGRAMPTRKGTCLAFNHNLRNLSVRLVAVDDDGAEHEGSVMSDSGRKEVQLRVAEFDLPPERIAGFRVQTRPDETVEVPGVVLFATGRPQTEP
jgi:hypothetical protein